MANQIGTELSKIIYYKIILQVLRKINESEESKTTRN